MTVLSEGRNDVEEDLFTVMDVGIVLAITEFDTVFFSGLHFHGGTQPIYKTNAERKAYPHVRMTLVAYPPCSFFEASTSSAFATLPGPAGTVMKVYSEMKDHL